LRRGQLGQDLGGGIPEEVAQDSEAQLGFGGGRLTGHDLEPRACQRKALSPQGRLPDPGLAFEEQPTGERGAIEEFAKGCELRVVSDDGWGVHPDHMVRRRTKSNKRRPQGLNGGPQTKEPTM
jgi:hypothetical protein